LPARERRPGDNINRVGRSDRSKLAQRQKQFELPDIAAFPGLVQHNDCVHLPGRLQGT
jgi:hypothetical protein